MPDQLRKMTWKQVRDILFHPCDDTGTLEIEYAGDGAPDSAERMRLDWQAQGLTAKEIEAKFVEFNEMLYAEQVCREKGFTPEETQRQLAIFRGKLIRQRAAKGLAMRS